MEDRILIPMSSIAQANEEVFQAQRIVVVVNV